MAEITAAVVGKLREMTGAGLMDCKKALSEAQGDLSAAGDILRKRGVATAVSKASREAKEGVIAQHLAPGGRLGVLVEINCETDFVARNDLFRAFAEGVARRLAPDPLEHGIRPDRLDHPAGVHVRQGREAEGDVLQVLYVDPAEPERD